MSRIGKKPVTVPSGVTVTLDGRDLKAKGPKGELAMTFVNEVTVEMNDNQITVIPRDDSKRSRSMWGMQRTQVSNLLEGVSQGFSKDLEIVGVGYRAQVKGPKLLNLQLGFSHEIDYELPDGITAVCEKPTSIKISGIDKQTVGQVAAEIRAFRPPEPYKGKGVKYAGEYIFRKEGKKK